MSIQNTSDTALSISELNSMVKDLLENSLPPLWVEGEISNFARPASGHMYFSLKDSGSQVRTVMFRNRNMLLDFKPENGSHVLARVKIGFYEARGEFQLIVERMQEAGDGRLQQAFEALKRKLASEGLFDEHLKQEIPDLPGRIGVITSPTGAAIRDVLSVLQRRFPGIPVTIYPVPVQGDEAAPAIARALNRASNQKYCDVLLLVRGGGSLEDLWAFNEEIVARAIHNCTIPVVSGVGHETDVTIADFAADLRAPTPSAAAELVTPDQTSYQQSFDYYSERLIQLITQKLKFSRHNLTSLQQRIKSRHPRQQLKQMGLNRLALSRRLLLNWEHRQQQRQLKLDHLLSRLLNCSPDHQVSVSRSKLEYIIRRLLQSIRFQQKTGSQKLASVSRTLQAISPLQTLARGFSIATKEGSTENLVDSQQVKEGDIINVHLHHGLLKSAVISRSSDKS